MSELARFSHLKDPGHTLDIEMMVWWGWGSRSEGSQRSKKSIFQLWSGIVLGWLKWPKNALKGHIWSVSGIHAGAKTPLPARSYSINEGIRAKIRFWCPTGYPGGSPGYTVGSSKNQNNQFLSPFRAFLGHFTHPRTIPDQS